MVEINLNNYINKPILNLVLAKPFGKIAASMIETLTKDGNTEKEKNSRPRFGVNMFADRTPTDLE